MLLSDVWRLSVAYIGPKSRTERPRKTKIGTEVAHVTRDSDTTFSVKRSKVKVTRPLCSPLCWRVRQLQRWAWKRVGRGKLLLRCRLLRRRKVLRRPRGEERGGGITWRPPAYSLFRVHGIKALDGVCPTFIGRVGPTSDYVNVIYYWSCIIGF